MKKFFILSLVCVFLCGCSPIEEMSMQEIIDAGTDRDAIVYNKYRKGYKYNLPRGLTVLDSTEYNEVIKDGNYRYYLYVDAVSHYNKVIEKYEVVKDVHTSMQISYEDKYGYLEINKVEDDKYFIEIMYNYAKIEVIVRDVDAKIAVSNAISILASIDFNDDVLKSLLDDETSTFTEIEVNIFETTATIDDDILQATDEEVEDDENEEVYDSDYID